jgi:hypothetical protein
MGSVTAGAAKTALQGRIDIVQTDVTAATNVIAEIAALPAVANLAVGNTSVATARGDYTALTANQKALVTNLSTLTTAEAQVTALNAADVAITTFEGAHTSGNLSAANTAMGSVTAGAAKTALQGRIDAVVAADLALANADKTALANNSIKGANSSLSNVMVALSNPLPSLGFVNDSTIAWASGTPGVVSNDGQTVNRPENGAGNATVTLTATLTNGTATVTKAFTLTVIQKALTTMAFALTTPAPGVGNTITGGGLTTAVNVDVVKNTSSVVITGTKTVAQTATVHDYLGAPDDSLNVTIGGTAIAPTYTVNMTTPGDDVHLGGNKTFTIVVSEAGKSDITYIVTVNVSYV